MFDVFFGKANELNARGEPFALAVVVRHEAPISGKPGDKALILADGTIHGWIGGGCTQPVIVKEAKAALRDGRTRLVRVTPTAGEAAVEGLTEYNMACYSGGTLDIYIEPVLPKPQLVILGASVVAQTLARLGKVLGYRIVAGAPEAGADLFPEADHLLTSFDLSALTLTPRTCVVVSTQGHGDEEALEAVLKHDLPYVSFVASHRKARQVFAYLEEQGFTSEQVARIKAPAGFDIGARLPEEIAVSILAEVVFVLRSGDAGGVGEPGSRRAGEGEAEGISPEEAVPTEAGEAVDPVCGMMVEMEGARVTYEHEGTTYYFCCPGCRHAFKKEPEKYLVESS